jgi:hypothetical protein
MDDKLGKIFYDPKIGISGVNQLYKKSKDKGYDYTLKQIKEWYFDQPVNQVYKEVKKVQKHDEIRSHRLEPGSFQADLMVMKKYSHYNKGYAYLFNIIDIYSRYAWSFPIKKKEASEIAPHLKKVIDEVKPKQIWITFDNGKEFMGDVKKYLDKQKAHIHLNDPHSIHSHNTMGIIERFNRTLLNKIRKYMTAQDTVKYVNVLDDIIYGYNHTEHSSTMRTPYEILKKNKVPIKVLENVYVSSNKFKVGDYVRYAVQKKTFDKKGFKNNYSFTVHKITGKKGQKYILDNDKQFYEEQLIKGNKDLNEIKKKHKEVNKKEKKRLDNLKEHGVEDITQFIREGKRVKKERKRYIEEI